MLFRIHHDIGHARLRPAGINAGVTGFSGPRTDVLSRLGPGRVCRQTETGNAGQPSGGVVEPLHEWFPFLSGLRTILSLRKKSGRLIRMRKEPEDLLRVYLLEVFQAKQIFA